MFRHPKPFINYLIDELFHSFILYILNLFTAPTLLEVIVPTDLSDMFVLIDKEMPFDLYCYEHLCLSGA